MYCALFTGKEKEYQIFKIPQTGSYFLYCHVQKNEEAKQECKDEIDLAWNGTASSDLKEIKNGVFQQVSTYYVAEIVAFNVNLKESSEVYLRINCPIKDVNAKLCCIYHQIKH